MKTILIDYRERSGLEDLVRKHAERSKMTTETQENLLADYVCGGLGIEAKTVQDFFQSLQSGHLRNQLANMDDNFERYALVVHGTLDRYVADMRRRGNRKTSFAQIQAQFIGALARFDVDFDVTLMLFSTSSEAARWIVKRCEKDGTLGSSTTLKALRRTSSEDVRIDALRGAGCSENMARALLERFGSITEIAGATRRQLMTVDGIGKVRAEMIQSVLSSESPVVKDTVRKTRV